MAKPVKFKEPHVPVVVSAVNIQMPIFDDATIENLFGAEAAEDENNTRFKQYFYSNSAYESVLSPLQIRILVGHKGIGKSALLKRAYLKDQEENRLCVWIRPNDLVSIKSSTHLGDFNSRIEHWKDGILRLIAEKSLCQFVAPERVIDKLSGLSIGKNVVSFIAKKVLELSTEFSGDAAREIAGTFGANQSISVYIDDIDRGWSASKEDISNISALLNALRDICGEDRAIRFRLSLRSDVYFLVRTSDESTDKIERNVVWLRWNNHEILCIAAQRIETFFGQDVSHDRLLKLNQTDITKNVLSKVIDERFLGKGHWDNRPIHNVLLSLTRARPRDLVKLFHGSAKQAFKAHSTIISSKNLENSFEAYSNERLQDIINEFRSEMPEIEKLLLRMKPSKVERRASDSFLFSGEQLRLKLNNVLSNVKLNFTNGKQVDARSLTHFLYKIDFITARKDLPDGRIDRKYFDESRFLASEVVEFGYNWEVHPAYRWALQPQDISSVFESIRLSS